MASPTEDPHAGDLRIAPHLDIEDTQLSSASSADRPEPLFSSARETPSEPPPQRVPRRRGHYGILVLAALAGALALARVMTG